MSSLLFLGSLAVGSDRFVAWEKTDAWAVKRDVPVMLKVLYQSVCSHDGGSVPAVKVVH